MALTWSIEAVADMDATCYVGDELSPVTESLIFATMWTGMPQITATNWREFYLRLHMHAQLYVSADYGTLNVDGVTPQQVEAHVGLRTNATEFTKAKFYRNLAGIMRERARNALTAAVKEVD